jgi:cytochrome c oxidase cbb3-type subunit 3
MAVQRLASLLAFCGLLVCAGIQTAAHAQKNVGNRGAQRFMEYCAGCHGADGRGGKAGSIATTPRVLGLSDAELTRIVREGEAAGMPPFAQIGDGNIAAIVFYLRTLQGKAAPTNSTAAVAVTGDENAGRTLYFGKAQCSRCHMIKGEGGFIASDLTAYGRGRTAVAILEAILIPDRPLAPRSRVVEVETKTGKKLTGVLRNEDNFNLELQTEDGRYHFLSRNEVTAVHYSDHSLMPHDYKERLTSEELNNIASFLIVTGRNAATDEASDGGHRGAN